ncbi:hypothetical protein BDV33DRAFT_210859 [Aspergillus novoparasiticus]|uniref:Uncharacterized protein n=1 Tax=Aspergillus novoparasiticus TaxID=986946 RepID=A0A5N6E655_9EURO|nr:hypothetical protein BDV33DRAFT_210859 [Aspergillus novoparasiticus]
MPCQALGPLTDDADRKRIAQELAANNRHAWGESCEIAYVGWLVRPLYPSPWHPWGRSWPPALPLAQVWSSRVHPAREVRGNASASAPVLSSCLVSGLAPLPSPLTERNVRCVEPIVYLPQQ